MHPTRRDGGIMTCFFAGRDVEGMEDLVVGQQAVMENCIQHLISVSGQATYTTEVASKNFGHLPPLTYA